MRIVLIITFLILSIGVKAQITSELSFDNKTKTVLLELKNEYDELIFLYPKRERGDKEATYYTIEYKDVKGKILYSFTTYVFDITSINRFLLHKKSQNYRLDLSTKTITNIFLVEVKLHIEARNGKRTVLIKDINKSYRWE